MPSQLQKKHISSQHILKFFVWAFFSKNHTNELPCRMTEKRKPAARMRSCKPCPWLRMTTHQLDPGLLFGELTHAAFGSQPATCSMVSLMPFSACIPCGHQHMPAPWYTGICLLLSVSQEREEENRQNWVSRKGAYYMCIICETL